MFIGPVFTREIVTAPRRPRLYVARAAYVAAARTDANITNYLARRLVAGNGTLAN